MAVPRLASAGPERVFAVLGGFVVNKRVGDEVYGDCPICGADNKFYINIINQLWSCKAGKPEHIAAHEVVGYQEGNLNSWLSAWVAQCQAVYDSTAPWEELAKDRGIAVAALHNSGLAWDGSRWLLPIYNLTNTVVSMHSYRYGEKLLIVEGLKSAIFGLDYLSEHSRNCTVYICEGPWDAITLQWQLGDSAPVVGVPGAGTFKREWIDYFTGHPVVVCYDNDVAGKKGAVKVSSTLVSVSPNVKQLNWPTTVADGTDIRSYFNTGGTLQELLSWVGKPAIPEENYIAPALLFDRPFGQMDFDEDVLSVFRTWLHMTDDMETSIRIAYAVILSNQLRGEPVWMQIVAPPGGGKTEVLRATSSVANTYFLSSIKPAALVSGWAKGDPSILPKLSHKTLVVKDLTTLISAPKQVRTEVFGILRDAYDGEADYQYGQGVIRHYDNIWFSALAGVTPAVFADPEAALGQRFLVYHSIKGASFDSREFVKRAAEGSRYQLEMREALAAITKEYLETKIEPSQVPVVPFKYRNAIEGLSQVTAKLRGVVERDQYNKDILLYPPQNELPTRLVQQLIRLGQFLAMLEKGMEFNQRVYSIVKQVAMDTCNPFQIILAKLLIGNSKGLNLDVLTRRTNMPRGTIVAKLEDMRRLESVVSNMPDDTSEARSFSGRVLYRLADPVVEFWKQAGLAVRNGYKPDIKNPMEGAVALHKVKITIKRDT